MGFSTETVNGYGSVCEWPTGPPGGQGLEQQDLSGLAEPVCEAALHLGLTQDGPPDQAGADQAQEQGDDGI